MFNCNYSKKRRDFDKLVYQKPSFFDKIFC
jgi:hypothetical protein